MKLHVILFALLLRRSEEILRYDASVERIYNEVRDQQIRMYRLL